RNPCNSQRGLSCSCSWHCSRSDRRCNDDRRRRASTLFARPRCINVPRSIDRQRGDFFLRGAIQDESLAIGRDPIDQAAAIGTRDQISIGVEDQLADVHFVTLKEKRMIPVRSDFEYFSLIACGNEQVAALVECEIPYVLCPGLEKHRGT